MIQEQSLYSWAQEAGWHPGPRTRRAQAAARRMVAGALHRIAPIIPHH